MFLLQFSDEVHKCTLQVTNSDLHIFVCIFLLQFSDEVHESTLQVTYSDSAIQHLLQIFVAIFR